MKTTLRHYGSVALLLAVILLASTCLSLLTGGRRDEEQADLLVTNYPLYVAAQNIIGDTDGVQVTMLSGVGTGCLHDYQLTPADRLALERADLILTNGAGPEPFLEGVDAVRVVNTSERIEKLSPADFWQAEVYYPEAGHAHYGHDHEKDAYNEHVWLSPERYIHQVGEVRDALMRLDPDNAPAYAANGADYVAVIHDGVLLNLPDLSGRPCVLFHDSLAYLAVDVGLDVQMVLTADGESGISAEDLAAVERLAQQHSDLILLYDTQYPIRYTAVDGLVPADQVISLETAVVGQGKASDWLDAMQRNIDKLSTLTEGGDTP